LPPKKEKQNKKQKIKKRKQNKKQKIKKNKK